MEDDYYKILGINRNASEADIQKAHRKLARKYHPDLHPDDASAKVKFQQVQKAYEVLSDSEKREMYDRYGSAFESMAGGGRAGGGWQAHQTGPGGNAAEFDFTQIFGDQMGGAPMGGGGFADIFRHFGGGGAGPRRRAARRAKGSDVHHRLQVPFATSITGGEARVVVQRGDGKKESIKVKIPAGVEDGQKIRLRGQGEQPGDDVPPGDLLITLNVTPHPRFQRRGKNLEVKVPVTLSEAALGAKVDVPTPHGTITLQVPACTSGGRRLRVKGHGVRGERGEPGDLYAEIQIVLPDSLTDSQREFFRDLARDNHVDPRGELKW